MALVGLAAGSAYLTRHCIAVANVKIQAELKIDDTQMGVVLGAFAAGYFLFQIPSGWLANRIGSRAAFTFISFCWSLCTVWTSAAGSVTTLLASRAVFGGFQAGLVPISAKVINDWFDANWRGVCSAVVAASMSAGGVVAMGLTSRLLASYDWRTIFQAYSLVGIAWAIVFALVFRTHPGEHPWIRSISGNTDHADDVAPEHDGETDKPVGADFVRLLVEPSLWGINTQSFFRAAGYGLLVTWFPAFLEYRFGTTTEQSGALAMYPLVAVIAGTLTGGIVVDLALRLTRSRFLSRTVVALVSLAVCGLFTAGSSLATDATTFVILISAGSFCSGLANPAAWAATMDLAGRQTSVVVGAMNMCGTAGAFLMPIVLGLMIGNIREEGGNWNVIVYFVAVVYLLGAACWLLVRPTSPPDDVATI